MDGKDEEVFEYPIAGRQYISSITVHSSHTGALGADFDGDVISMNILYTKESIVEVDKMLVSKSYYLTPEGNFNYPAANDILNLVVKHLTDW